MSKFYNFKPTQTLLVRKDNPTIHAIQIGYYTPDPNSFSSLNLIICDGYNQILTDEELRNTYSRIDLTDNIRFGVDYISIFKGKTNSKVNMAKLVATLIEYNYIGNIAIAQSLQNSLFDLSDYGKWLNLADKCGLGTKEFLHSLRDFIFSLDVDTDDQLTDYLDGVDKLCGKLLSNPDLTLQAEVEQLEREVRENEARLDYYKNKLLSLQATMQNLNNPENGDQQ